MILHPVDLTSALRPALLQDEALLFVQDAVGLYQGNSKVQEYQNGHLYLTSHRACYVDNEDPRAKSVAVLLKDVERSEAYAGFLKSSPKVTLLPKAAKQFGQVYRPTLLADGSSTSGPASSRPQSAAPRAAPSNVTWVCEICSYSNAVPPNFDPATANDGTPLPPCQTCGMKPTLLTLVRAALAANRAASNDVQRQQPLDSDSIPAMAFLSEVSLCPRCTYENHPSMTVCEMCGAALKSSTPQPPSTPLSGASDRTGSPGPTTSAKTQNTNDPMESMKFSFRAGGEKIFLERLKGALVQRKWMLQRAPSAPPTPVDRSTPPPTKAIGISGLERRDSEMRKNNEVVIGNAFDDLSTLMASAKEIIALAENFAKQGQGTSQGGNGSSASEATPVQSTDQASTLLSSLNLTTTKDMLGASSASSAQHTTYLTQLARSVVDFLLDDSSGTAVLKSAGGIISLVDLWAVYNRARGGVELVSPHDFSDAVALFEKLKLPVQSRVFRSSGLKVVRGAEWSDERAIKAILSWIREVRERIVLENSLDRIHDGEAEETGIQWGRGVTALEAADRFGWSVGVASEELEMAEEQGALCREVGLEGVKFWENWFIKDLAALARLDGQ